MITRFLVLVILLLFSCSKDDESESLPKIFLPDLSNINVPFSGYIFNGYDIGMRIEKFLKLSEGDSIAKINATTNFGQLIYEITSQNIENAFKIDPKTGVILVHLDEELHAFKGTEYKVGIKISNGNAFVGTRLVINIDSTLSSTCEAPLNNFINTQVQWFIGNNLKTQEIQFKAIQFNFSLSKDKSMCVLNFPYSNNYNANTTIQVQLIDDIGQILLNKIVTPSYNDWYGWIFDMYPLDIPLVKDKEYTLKLSYNQNSIIEFFYTYPDNSSISFPIEWGDVKLIGFSYTDSNGDKQTNKTLHFLGTGLVDL